jgi:hypothetical protein
MTSASGNILWENVMRRVIAGNSQQNNQKLEELYGSPAEK